LRKNLKTDGKEQPYLAGFLKAIDDPDANSSDNHQGARKMDVVDNVIYEINQNSRMIYSSCYSLQA